jgi:uncharacterized cupredoxin-like copper-binding protein
MRPAAALLALVLLAGCGDGKEVAASGSTVRVTVDEYRLQPQRIRVRGPRVVLVLTDNGILTHNLKVFSTTEFDAEDKPILLGGTKTAHPGETVTGVVDLPPGRYRIACSIANHDDLGEHGELIVAGRSGDGGGES